MNSHSRLVVTVALGLVIGGSGCSSSDLMGVPEVGAHPSILELNGKSFMDIPAEATAGTEVVVAIDTWFGPELARSRGETEVSVEGALVRIRPFDHYDSDILVELTSVHYTREATVNFPAPGSYRVEVIGRSMPGYRPFTIVGSVRVTN